MSSQEFSVNFPATAVNTLDVAVRTVQTGRRSIVGRLRAILSDRRASLVLLDADRLAGSALLAGMLRLGGTRGRVVALVLRPPWHARDIRKRAKALAWRPATWLPNVRLMTLGDCFGELPHAVPAKVRIIADKPALYGSAEPTSRRTPSGNRQLLLGGVIDERKAADLVCEGALRHTDMTVRIVGAVAPSVLPALRALATEFPERLSITDDFVPNEQLDAAISTSDVVSVVLRTPLGSSGLLGRATCHAKPVICGGNETVVATVTKRALGVAVAELTVAQVGTALNAVQGDYAAYRQACETAGREIAAATDLAVALLDAAGAAPPSDPAVGADGRRGPRSAGVRHPGQRATDS